MHTFLGQIFLKSCYSHKILGGLLFLNSCKGVLWGSCLWTSICGPVAQHLFLQVKCLECVTGNSQNESPGLLQNWGIHKNIKFCRMDWPTACRAVCPSFIVDYCDAPLPCDSPPARQTHIAAVGNTTRMWKTIIRSGWRSKIRPQLKSNRSLSTGKIPLTPSSVPPPAGVRIPPSPSLPGPPLPGMMSAPHRGDPPRMPMMGPLPPGMMSVGPAPGRGPPMGSCMPMMPPPNDGGNPSARNDSARQIRRESGVPFSQCCLTCSPWPGEAGWGLGISNSMTRKAHSLFLSKREQFGRGVVIQKK